MNLKATESKTLACDTDLTIRPLAAADAGSISGMLLAQRAEYARFFFAFEFNEAQIAEILARRKRDVYSGLFWQGELVGLFMLRGWDEGYDVPSFGVFVAEKYRGGAFMRISLNLAKLICRLSGSRRLRATIHPDNISPRGAVKLGFVESGKTTDAGNIVYHMDL